MRSSLDACLDERSVNPYSDAVIKLLYVHADFFQFFCNRLKMLRNNIFYKNIALCSSSGNHKCTGFYLVRDNGVICAVKPLHASYFDNVSTCTHDICAHRVEEVCKVNDMRLFCSIFNNGKSLCLNGCKHGVHGSSYGNDIEEYLISVKSVCCKVYHALTESVICSES